MRLYVYDVVEQGDNGVVLLRCMTEEGGKILIKQVNAKRQLWFRDVKVSADALESYVCSRLHIAASVFRSVCTVDKRYLQSSGYLGSPTPMQEYEVPAFIEQQLLADLGKKTSCYKECFGYTDNLVEQLVVRYALSGWMDIGGVEHVADSVYQCRSFEEFTSVVDPPQRPNFRTAVVYNNEIFDVVTDTVHKELYAREDLLRVLRELDAHVVLIYGRHHAFLHGQIGKNAIIDVHRAATDAKLTYASSEEFLEGGVREVFDMANRLKLVEMMCELSSILWQPWSQTAKTTQKMQRIQWMVYRAFSQANVLSPAYVRNRTVAQRNWYKGGTVLNAVQGVYDEGVVHLLDYRSLYPSVAIEHSICWSSDGSILPKLWRDLIQRRQDIAQMEGMEVMAYCLKLLANTTYGMLASPYFRYYAPHLAEIITAQGREALSVAVSEVPHGLIYGDTDSIFIHDVQGASGSELASKISSRFSYLLMKHECDYQRLFLVGKKRYVAFDTEGRRSVKGMTCVKKSYCPLGRHLVVSIFEWMKEQSDYALILDHALESLRSTLDDLAQGRVSMQDLVIVRRLAKSPRDYDNVKGQYHVQAALACTTRRYEKNDYVRYCMFGDRHPVAHESLNTEHDVRSIDVQWYSSQLRSMVDEFLNILPGYTPERLHELSSSSSSSSTTSRQNVVDDQLERRGMRTFCFNCDELKEHRGLLDVEMEVEERKKQVCQGDQHIYKNLSLSKDQCFECGDEFNLEMSARTLVFNRNLRETAMLCSNYDCNRLLSKIPCRECRRCVFTQLSNVGQYDLYENLLMIME